MYHLGEKTVYMSVHLPVLIVLKIEKNQKESFYKGLFYIFKCHPLFYKIVNDISMFMFLRLFYELLFFRYRWEYTFFSTDTGTVS